jgi:hypothetical protein
VRAGSREEADAARFSRSVFSVPTGARMRKNRDVPWNS